MELPQIGNFCSICGSLDFVPFICPHCRKQLCGDHASMPNHECSNLEENNISSPLKPTDSDFFQCTFCNAKETVEIKCRECGFSFCLTHRYPESHSCKVLDFRQKLQSSKNQQILSSSDVSSKSKAPAIAVKKPKNAKNEALAKKVALMKLKQIAKGDTKVAMEERFYFNLKLPNQKLVHVFFNRRLQIGRIIDMLCSEHSIKLKNENLQLLSLVHELTDSKLEASSELFKFDNWNCGDFVLKYL